MKRKILNSLLVLGITFGITGCIEPMTPESYVQKHDDKEMAKAFSKFLKIPAYYTYPYQNEIKTEMELIDFKDKVALGNVRNYIIENGFDNEIYNTYASTVKARGNILVKYKGALAQDIYEASVNGNLKTFDTTYLKYYYYDTMPVYAELDKNTNELKSILFGYVTVQAMYDQYRDNNAPAYVKLITTIKSGNKLNLITNSIPNSKFEDYLISKN